MPYKDLVIKREYQRRWVKEKRQHVEPSVEPMSNPVRPKPEELRQLIKNIENRPLEIRTSGNCGYYSAHLYNPSIHKAGDTVLVKGKVVTIPLLDAEGREIPDHG